MGVFDKVVQRLRGKAEPPIINDGDRNLPSIRILRGPYQVPARAYSGSGSSAWGMAWGSLDYQTQAREGYSRNSDVYACVSLIAQAACQVKWYDGSAGSKGITPLERKFMALKYSAVAHQTSELHNTPAKREAFLKPQTNPRASMEAFTNAGGSVFLNAWISSLLISGNAFIEIQRSDKDSTTGPIVQLHLLRTDRVAPKPRTSGPYQDETNIVESWEVYAYGRPRIVQTANMVHSKLYNPLDDVMGMAPLDAAMMNVLLHNEGTDNIRRVLNRGAVPGWIELDKDSEWTEKQILALKDKLRRARSGEDELTLQYAQWHELGIKPSESAYADAQAITKRDIASVYHVDPVLIGDMAGRTYATYRESRRGLYMEAVIPPLTMFRDDWNRTIGVQLNSAMDFDKDSFDAITAAREEATDRVVKLWQIGLIDRTEARADLAYDPVAGDEQEFYAPASFMPMAKPGDNETP